ncbi:MAG TPA: protein kinase [Candidatus Angelobacter sp.]|nr:protein kinase [Candidatus Angelobacter sp.]
MSQQLWKKAETLFHEALARTKEDRETFLAQACDGNQSLYDEVKSLLFYHREDDQLLGDLTVPSLDEMLEPAPPAFKNGDLIGLYQVIDILGSGGMGEVYLARHPRLGNKVALKVLPKFLAVSPELTARLRREAQTASALNHPNILAIYDFLPHGDLQYIVSEFVEGKQLREFIGRLSVADALHYARQIGQALAAAHAAGIVHRDIKPENVMVRSDGYIKVLDFGLAKITDSKLASGQSLYKRLASNGAQSIPGMLMGTVNYMSPEQARGEAVDARTDIWSWGVVLYEMLTGEHPFKAPTASDTLAAILSKTPDPPGGDKRLDGLVAKALAKQPEDRYQNISEVLDELSHVSPESRIPARGRQASVATRETFFQYLLAMGARFRWIYIGLFLATFLLAARGIYRSRRGSLDRTFQHFSITRRLTESGNVPHAAISADGSYVAYATNETGGRQAIWIQKMDSSGGRQIVPPEPGECIGITFSRDGKFVYYVMKAHEVGKLYKIPSEGGKPQVVALNVDSAVSFSPDGGRFAFLRVSASDKHASIVLSNTEETEETLVTLRPPDYFRLIAPAWSPDGHSVVSVMWTGTPIKYQLMSVGVEDKQQRRIQGGLWSWSSIWKLVWLGRSGRHIAVTANDIGESQHSQLEEITWPSGEISPMIRDLGNYIDMDATADSRKIAAIQVEHHSKLWVAPMSAPDDGHLLQLADSFDGLAWTKFEQLIVPSNMSGESELLAIDTNNGKQRVVIRDQNRKYYPVASPDGRYLVYASNRDDGMHLWRSNGDGEDAVRLTSTSPLDRDAAISPKSNWVVYTSIGDGIETLWRTPIDGGDEIPITHLPARKASISPDGEQIACEYSENQGQGWKVTILRWDGQVVKSFPKIPTPGLPVRWYRHGKSLLYVVTDNNVSNVWEQPVDGGAPRQITHFREELIFAFALSPDERSLACIRGSWISNVVLIEGMD